MTKDEERIIAIQEQQRRLKYGIKEKADRDILQVDEASGICVKVYKRLVTQTQAEEIIKNIDDSEWIFPIVEHGKYHLGSIYKVNK